MLTLIPSFIKSAAIARDIPIIAAFVAPYIHLLGAPTINLNFMFGGVRVAHLFAFLYCV